MKRVEKLVSSPPLVLSWLGEAEGGWGLFDTGSGVRLSTHRSLLLAEAAQIAESFRREGES